MTEERPLTEDEYRAWLAKRLPQMAEEFTVMLPQEARDAGMRVEWVDADAGDREREEGEGRR